MRPLNACLGFLDKNFVSKAPKPVLHSNNVNNLNLPPAAVVGARREYSQYEGRHQRWYHVNEGENQKQQRSYNVNDGDNRINMENQHNDNDIDGSQHNYRENSGSKGKNRNSIINL